MNLKKCAVCNKDYSSNGLDYDESEQIGCVPKMIGYKNSR